MTPTDQIFSIMTNQTTQSLMNMASTIATVVSAFGQKAEPSHQEIYHIYQPDVSTPSKEANVSLLLILSYSIYFITTFLLLTHNLQSISSQPLILMLCIASLIPLITIYIYRYTFLRLLLVLTVIATIAFANPYLIPLATQMLTTNQNPTTLTSLTPTDQAKQVIEQFYQDINKKDYRAAYYLTANGFSESYNQFAEGFKYTEHDDISFNCIKQLPDETVQVTITIIATENQPAGTHVRTYYAQYTIGLDHGAYIILRGSLLPTHPACNSNKDYTLPLTLILANRIYHRKPLDRPQQAWHSSNRV